MRVQDAEEAAESAPELDAVLIDEPCISELATRQQRPAEEGRREAIARHADEARLGDRNRKEPCKARQHGQLAFDQRYRDGAARESKRPPLLDGPDRVVPPFADQPRGVGVELRELLGEERPHERTVDRDLGIPVGHRGNVLVHKTEIPDWGLQSRRAQRT